MVEVAVEGRERVYVLMGCEEAERRKVRREYHSAQDDQNETLNCLVCRIRRMFSILTCLCLEARDGMTGWAAQQTQQFSCR